MDAEQIEKLAKLARLNIAPDQVGEVAERISNVLKWWISYRPWTPPGGAYVAPAGCGRPPARG